MPDIEIDPTGTLSFAEAVREHYEGLADRNPFTDAEKLKLDTLPRGGTFEYRAPVATDDETQGYDLGAMWFRSGGGTYVCTGAGMGEASWQMLSEKVSARLPLGQDLRLLGLRVRAVAAGGVGFMISAEGAAQQNVTVRGSVNGQPAGAAAVITLDATPVHPLGWTGAGTLGSFMTVFVRFANGHLYRATIMLGGTVNGTTVDPVIEIERLWR